MNKRLRGLDGLSLIKRQLQETQQQATQAREQAAREQRERDLFALTVGPIVPLRGPRRVQAPRKPPAPVPRQRLLDEAAVLRESISDEFDVETLLDTDEALSFRRTGIGEDVTRKLRRGVWVIQAHLDLHGLRRDEARERLSHFLDDAVAQGWRCVRVVHGKGHGSPGRVPVLKNKVRTWLVQRLDVIAFVQARGHEGGNGALVVLLRP